MAILYAKIGADWVPVGGGGGGGGTAPNEVFVGPDDPIATHPETELWYDTDEPGYTAEDLRWQSAWGVVGSAQITASRTGIGTSAVNVVGVTVTLVAGRRYKIIADLFPYKNPGDTTAGNQSQIYCDTTLIAQRNFDVIAPGQEAVHMEVLYELHGVHNFHLDVATFAGALSVLAAPTYPTWIAVEDVGPAVPTGNVPSLVTPWTALTLLNTWTHSGGNTSLPQYRKVGDMVQVRGSIKKATTMTLPSVQTVATLPAGYRPPFISSFAVVMNGSDGWNGVGAMDVGGNGDLQIYRTAQGAANPHAFTAFDFQFSVSA